MELRAHTPAAMAGLGALLKGPPIYRGDVGRPCTKRPAREPGGAFASVRDSCRPLTGAATACPLTGTDGWRGLPIDAGQAIGRLGSGQIRVAVR